MFNKKTNSILAVALIVGILGIGGVAMAAANNPSMPCSDPAFRQQMLDSHVKSGYMTQEQADLMKQQMDQMMSGGQMMKDNQPGSMMNGGQMNPMMPHGPMNPATPQAPQGN